MRRGLAIGLVCAVGMLSGRAAWADGVVLTNGDILHGDVVSLNGEKLVLQSQSLGEITLQRPNVASIHFGDVRVDRQRPAVPAAAPLSPAAEAEHAAAVPGDQPARTPEELIGQLTGKNISPPPAGGSTEEALRQLQSGGLGPQTLSEVQKALPLVNTPEVRDYFNSTVGGLMSGSLSIQDVRKDAVKARDTILDLKKDLGPGADALNGYLSILEGFIEETTPAGAPADGAAGPADPAPGLDR